MARQHRGRIQAQGEQLEVSVDWNQDTPLTVDEGLALLAKLEAQLTRADRAQRRTGLEQARRWMIRVRQAQGIEALIKKSFPQPNNSRWGIRIDIEILSGAAFIE